MRTLQIFYFISPLLHVKLREEEKHCIALRVLLSEAFAASSISPFMPSPFRGWMVFSFSFFLDGRYSPCCIFGWPLGRGKDIGINI